GVTETSDRPGVADLAVEQGPLDADLSDVAEARLQRRRSVALAPVGVGSVAVERGVAIARRRRERPLARRDERGALSLTLISRFPGRPSRYTLTAGAREDLDDAADGVGAVERRERPANDFDAFDVLRRQRRPVVASEVGRVQAHAVDEHERLGRVGAAREER